MKKLIITITISLLSLNIFASNTDSVSGQDAVEITKVLSSLRVAAQYTPAGDSGYSDLRKYTFMGLDCIVGYSPFQEQENGEYDSILTGTCYLDNLGSQAELENLKNLLRSSGLNSNNKLFSLSYQE